MPYQLRFDQLEEFEHAIIQEKIARVNIATNKGLAERPPDENMVGYVKNKAVRLIEWVLDSNLNWFKRERLERQTWSTEAGKWVRTIRPTELVEFKDMRQVNRDILPVDAFVDQGTSQPKDPRFPSDKAVLGECVQARDGKLLAFSLKTKELEPTHLQVDWLMEHFDIDSCTATRYAETFRSFSLNRTSARILIAKLDRSDNPEAIIAELGHLETELPEVMPKHEQNRLADLPEDPLDQLAEEYSLSEYSVGNAFPDDLIEKRRLIHHASEQKIEQDGFETSCFGMHPLHYEEDGCSHEFLTFLRFASIKEIKAVMKGFFPQRDQSGRKLRPRFWYLTPSQRSQAWEYINTRRTKLGIYSPTIKLSLNTKGGSND